MARNRKNRTPKRYREARRAGTLYQTLAEDVAAGVLTIPEAMRYLLKCRNVKLEGSTVIFELKPKVPEAEPRPQLPSNCIEGRY